MSCENYFLQIDKYFRDKNYRGVCASLKEEDNSKCYDAKKSLIDLQFKIELNNLNNRRAYLTCLDSAYDCQKMATMSIIDHLFNMSSCLDVTKMCHNNRREYLVQYEKYQEKLTELEKFIKDKS